MTTPQSAPRPDIPDTLVGLTHLPTVAGREHHVLRFIRQWLRERPALLATEDRAGNLLILHRDAPDDPVLFTAHLDHPGFVVESIDGERDATLSFRGGVHGPYFTGARLDIHSVSASADTPPIRATIVAHDDPSPPQRPDRVVRVRSEAPLTSITPGDIAVWDLPEPEADPEGRFHARVCDDLAALAAALDALDQLQGTDAAPRAGLLCTRAEEIGFIGAIAACKLGTIPRAARVLALENSRSFPDSPLGAGPIVRVGDRLSTFSPTLNAAVARVAQSLTGKPDKTVGTAAVDEDAAFKWQRKLMPGGACEATAYHAYGYESTCLCLPLGNYHNMAALTDYETAVKQGREPVAVIEREYIALEDYRGLVALLVACARHLEAAEPLIDRLEKLYDERKHVLSMETPA